MMTFFMAGSFVYLGGTRALLPALRSEAAGRLPDLFGHPGIFEEMPAIGPGINVEELQPARRFALERNRIGRLRDAPVQFVPIGNPHADVMEDNRSEEHTSELQSLMRNSSAVFCLQKQTPHTENKKQNIITR